MDHDLEKYYTTCMELVNQASEVLQNCGILLFNVRNKILIALTMFLKILLIVD